jgi:hypothetical protein
MAQHTANDNVLQYIIRPAGRCQYAGPTFSKIRGLPGGNPGAALKVFLFDRLRAAPVLNVN